MKKHIFIFLCFKYFNIKINMRKYIGGGEYQSFAGTFL